MAGGLRTTRGTEARSARRWSSPRGTPRRGEMRSSRREARPPLPSETAGGRPPGVPNDCGQAARKSIALEVTDRPPCEHASQHVRGEHRNCHTDAHCTSLFAPLMAFASLNNGHATDFIRLPSGLSVRSVCGPSGVAEPGGDASARRASGPRGAWRFYDGAAACCGRRVRCSTASHWSWRWSHLRRARALALLRGQGQVG